MVAEKKHILFVDDEQHVLDGLRRALRNLRWHWEMVFVSSREDALELNGRNRVRGSNVT